MRKIELNVAKPPVQPEVGSEAQEKLLRDSCAPGWLRANRELPQGWIIDRKINVTWFLLY